MKICFIICRKYDDSPRAIREVNSLAKHFDLHVIEFDKTGNLQNKKVVNNIQITRAHAKRLFAFNFLNAPIVLLTLLRSVFRSQADAYHCFGFIGLIVGILAKIFTGKMLIFDAYEDYPYQFSKNASNKIFSRIKASVMWNIVYAFESLFLHFADCVLTVPSYGDVLLKRLQIHHKFVFVIWNVPNPDFFENKKSISQQKNVKSNIIYVGGIAKNRGIFEILTAISLVKKQRINVNILLVGTNEINNIEKYLKELDILENVTFTGSLPPDKLNQYLTCAKVGLTLYQPTYWHLRTKASEKLFIYMLFSIPVIASNFPGLSEIINTHNCGILVNPSDSKEIAKAITYLLKNPSISQNLGKNGKKAIENKYNWKIEEKKLAQIYKGLIFNEKRK